MRCEEVIRFWFEETAPELWWKKDEKFDQTIDRRFAAWNTAAGRCELYQWRDTAVGRLAEIIILDQFSRNLFRGQALSFANDALALALAQEAINVGADMHLDPPQRCFMYMPFMHSESSVIHKVAVDLFTNLGLDSNLQFELRHKKIIDRFGRYPHRNKILGRESTADELAFLKEPGSSF